MNGVALCAGIGGIELGLKRAIPEYRTVCYCEQNAFAAAVLVARMEEKALDQAPIWDDIKTFSGIEWRGIVDCISAGFPCQPFSIAGPRRLSNDVRWIWPDIFRIIKEIEPAYIFLENVPGFIMEGGGLSEVLSDLSASGYDARWDCFSAFSIGAPHRRSRFFLLAYPSGKRLPRQKRTAEWNHATTKRPGWNAEPAICRVDDGTPFRVDRLHCLGNAVVPAQAELAWRILTR